MNFNRLASLSVIPLNACAIAASATGHSKRIWSFDSVKDDIPLARACLTATQDKPCKTSQRYLP